LSAIFRNALAGRRHTPMSVVMNTYLIEAWLAMLIPAAIGFALPRVVRRSLLLVSTIILVISLFGQGVHDDHFKVYFCNLFFLIGSIARECVNVLACLIRRLTSHRIATTATESPKL
jgi:hypothetical protein